MARQRKRKGDPVHGWLAVDKPVGVTSTQVVSRLKRLFNAQKVGHGGTLDPLASGILPIAFGEATKTVQWAMDAEKVYQFTMTWGRSTTTLDDEGEDVARSDVRPLRADIEAVLPQFVGEIAQVPPKYSAIKVDGARAYDLARDGQTFELETRRVSVFEAELVDCPNEDCATIRVVSGKGFYVRAMARDIAAALGAEGHVSELRRLRVGDMDIESSFALGDIANVSGDQDALTHMLRPLQTVLDMPVVEVTRAEAAFLRQGRHVLLMPHILEAWHPSHRENRYVLVLESQAPIALAEINAGRLQPRKVFQL